MEPNWNTLLWEIIQALLSVLIPALVAALVAFTRRQWSEATANLKRQQPDLFFMLSNVADAAVNAAEQALAKQPGMDKKAYALAVTQKWLKQNNVHLDATLIDAAIETAVRTEINRDTDKTSSRPIGFLGEEL